jgi:hypothetical protein
MTVQTIKKINQMESENTQFIPMPRLGHAW